MPVASAAMDGSELLDKSATCAVAKEGVRDEMKSRERKACKEDIVATFAESRHRRWERGS